MPSANRLTTPIDLDEVEIEGRYAELDGFTVGFETHRTDLDPAELFRGLPDDRCQCPHWGVVTGGQITFVWADRQETYVEGDAYYAGPGHLPLMTAGTTLIEFSPTAELDATMSVVGANLEAAKAQGAPA